VCGAADVRAALLPMTDSMVWLLICKGLCTFSGASGPGWPARETLGCVKTARKNHLALMSIEWRVDSEQNNGFSSTPPLFTSPPC
jgi:hypothetical protein